DFPLLRSRQQTMKGPVEGLAVDIFLEQPLSHHQSEVFPCSAPRGIGGFVDNMAQVVESTGIDGLAGLEPGFARLAALPGASSESENFDLYAAAFQSARQNVGAGCGHSDRPSAHGA